MSSPSYPPTTHLYPSIANAIRELEDAFNERKVTAWNLGHFSELPGYGFRVKYGDLKYHHVVSDQQVIEARSDVLGAAAKLCVAKIQEAVRGNEERPG